MLSSSAESDPKGRAPGGHRRVWEVPLAWITAAVSVTEMLSVMSKPTASRMLGCLDRNYYFLTLLSLLPCQGDTSGDFMKALLALCGGED